MAKIELVKFASAFVKNIGIIAGENDPQLKLAPVGFLKLLLANPAQVAINNIQELRKGQHRTIKVKYLSRALESEVTSTDNCETDDNVKWGEHEITHNLYRKIGIFIAEDDMRDYEDEALDTISAGENQQVALMRPLYEILLSKLTALVSSIDSALIAEQATNWGVNAAYSPKDANPKTIKFGERISMSDGDVKLDEDAVLNEVVGKLHIVGNGVIARYAAYNKHKNGTDFNGAGASNIDLYTDNRTITGWGRDHFGVFTDGSVAFVPWNAYVGPYSGDKGNGDVFFTLPVPVEIDGQLSTIVFDAQLRYNSCPIEKDGVVVKPRGYDLIVGLHFGLFNQPTDAFQTGDPLHGVNGTFHYVGVEDNGIAVKPTADAVFKTQAQ